MGFATSTLALNRFMRALKFVNNKVHLLTVGQYVCRVGWALSTFQDLATLEYGERQAATNES